MTGKVALSPALMPAQVLLELGHQAAAAELDEVVAGRGVALLLPPIVPSKSMTTKSPSPAGPLDRLEPRGALAQRLELLVERALGHLGLGLADLEAR